ncbi:MAG: Bug family tripartite tricarboxylate transporter substrate binding protein [Variovorax sp.]|uniref:Bug family tripartite tricarboxylate transporter substrate binding protein n=1 Tax=Variovorax sp. TaxID=1871043 RepID=UPI004037F2AF
MTPSKRRLLLCALAVFAATSARAEFPSKPLRIVVQYQAGGSSDILARLVAEGLSKRLGQPVVVENRSGAGGIIGTDYVAKSAPDGHTLLLTVPGPVTANIVLYGKLPYDPRTDLRMVSDIATTRTVLAVHPSVPAKDVAGLIAVLKAAPGKYAMGSWGPGTQPHQIQVYMDRAYGLRTLHVPYKGESPMAIDLIGGVIQLTVGSIATLQPYIAAGKLRARAVAGPRRAKALPEVPTFAEQGFADEVYALTGPTSLMAPAKTPDAVVERLGREVAAVVHQPEVARRIEELGAEPVGNLPAEASAAYRAFLPVTLRLTQATGVKLD